MTKLRVGWFTFTCCEDSTILFTEMLNTHWDDWKDKIEFVNARILKANNIVENLDVSFIEGSISSQEQVDKLKEIRKNSKTVVAIGACACTAMPSGWRNSFDEETKEEIKFLIDRYSHLEKVEPLKTYITVDESVQGCPMNEERFLELMEKTLSNIEK